MIAEARTAGCNVRVDAAGNVHARPAWMSWEEKAWLSGSHIDSVPTGGKYDGVVGVAVPLEILRVNPKARIELVIFAEEEGTTFNLGMLGSRTWAGTLGEAELAGLRNKDGRSPLEAGRGVGSGSGAVCRRQGESRVLSRAYRGYTWSRASPCGAGNTPGGRR